MISLEWIWVLALLPLPWLFRYILPVAKRGDEAVLRVPFIEDFTSASTRRFVLDQHRWLYWTATLAWLSLLVAAARPQWIGEPVDLPVSGRDILLAVDLSGSMKTRDFVLGNRDPVDRLTATKAVAGEFIKRRTGDRIGLILFGRQAYVQTPLTFDRDTVRKLLNEAVIGMAGRETAIGDAIGLAVKRIRDIPPAMQSQTSQTANTNHQQKPILILLTDGANTAGEVDPLQAAQFAAAEGLKIYTIGIGADEMLVPLIFGYMRDNPSLDLDENTLRAIAKATGGKYFRARDTQELEKIYHMLDKLEPVARESKTYRPKQALYMWPLIFALILGGIVLSVQAVKT